MSYMSLQEREALRHAQGRVAQLILLAQRLRAPEGPVPRLVRLLAIGLRELNLWMCQGYGLAASDAGLLHDLLDASRGFPFAEIRLHVTALTMNLARLDAAMLDGLRQRLQSASEEAEHDALLQQVQDIAGRTPAAHVRRAARQLLYTTNAQWLKPPKSM